MRIDQVTFHTLVLLFILYSDTHQCQCSVLLLFFDAGTYSNNYHIIITSLKFRACVTYIPFLTLSKAFVWSVKCRCKSLFSGSCLTKENKRLRTFTGSEEQYKTIFPSELDLSSSRKWLGYESWYVNKVFVEKVFIRLEFYFNSSVPSCPYVKKKQAIDIFWSDTST